MEKKEREIEIPSSSNATRRLAQIVKTQAYVFCRSVKSYERHQCPLFRVRYCFEGDAVAETQGRLSVKQVQKQVAEKQIAMPEDEKDRTTR